jgi:hypothetical protein
VTAPPPGILPHVDAIEAALTDAGLAVSVGAAPDPLPAATGWVVLYPDPGRADAASLADDRTLFEATVQATCVGATAAQALWVADTVRTALTGPLTAAGRAVWRPEELGGPPLARDDDVSPPLYFLAVQFRLRSTTG